MLLVVLVSVFQNQFSVGQFAGEGLGLSVDLLTSPVRGAPPAALLRTGLQASIFPGQLQLPGIEQSVLLPPMALPSLCR